MAAKDPKPLPELSANDIAKFWSCVETKSNDDCWPWKGCSNDWGYGILNIAQHKLRVHRIAYFLHYGTDPWPLLVCHVCDRPSCCNWRHLFTGTVLDNTQDARNKKRLDGRKGDRNNILLPKVRQIIDTQKSHGDQHWTKIHPDLVKKRETHYAYIPYITREKIRALYTAGGISQKMLGERFNICTSSVSNIILKLRG